MDSSPRGGHPLEPLFRPRSVAIVGASSDPNKVGGRPLAFLKKAGWQGRILPVNPSAADVQGVPAFASLAAIDGPIDQAIVAVPAAQVLPVADDCIARGVKALQVFSSGFGEGPAAAQAQRVLRERARAGGMRILGPNSLGLFNAVDGFFGTFATALDGAWPQAGGVGVATQSGAFGSYFFGMAQLRGLGFSHFVATGNELDVDVADCVQFLAQDPATRLIVMAVEGCKDGRKLVAALEAARAAGKPVLAMKVGVSQAGAQAAATHTGSLSGEDRVFDAVLRDAGCYRAGSLQDLVEAAYAATIGPMPQGRRLLVVTTSGGIGVLSADAAEANGLELPAISGAALRDIQGIAPLAGGQNPVDTSAGILGDLSAYARIASLALDDQPCDAVLCYLAHIARNPQHWAQLREPLYALRRKHPDKAFAAVLLADTVTMTDLEANGFSVFADPTVAVRALAALTLTVGPASSAVNPAFSPVIPAFSPVIPASSPAIPASSPAIPASSPVIPAKAGIPGARAEQREARSALPDAEAGDPRLRGDDGGGRGSDDDHRLQGHTDSLATESGAKRALAAHGITFAPELVVHDADQAVAAARGFGWPVVLKIVSPDIAHKTEAGGVQLGIGDETSLREALPAMRERVERHAPSARITGFLVAKQLRGGVEVLVGTQRDPVFGPVVTVGSGGVLTELLQDVCVKLAPVDEATALRMLEATKAGRLLDGWRGAPACDKHALARQVAALSRVAWAGRDRIAGIDLNPVLALPEGAYALDALIALQQTEEEGGPA
jgi:acyl-CoA synthetase (NDP forming)